MEKEKIKCPKTTIEMYFSRYKKLLKLGYPVVINPSVIEEVKCIQRTRRTALFNCIHKGIEFGAPNNTKPNYEWWEPLLPK